ncbi:uncharacterized protein LOC101205851 isoform X2 [Cucumis sativus]|nr:uncharacterized protein LOC101205851 isoform X2 [Cucumis sativus]
MLFVFGFGFFYVYFYYYYYLILKQLEELRLDYLLCRKKEDGRKRKKKIDSSDKFSKLLNHEKKKTIMVSDPKSTLSKLKPDGGSRLKLESSDHKKKIDSSIKNSIPSSKHKSVSLVTKAEVKSKTISSSSKTTTKTTTTTTATAKVREKKVFNLPGQKYDPPEEREPLRIFYESLSKQIPASEMAEFWMMEHGMLSPEKAKKAYEKKLRRQKEQRTGTPIKSASAKPLSRPESSQRPQPPSKNGDIKAKKKIVNDSDDDDDFILSPKRRKM